LGISTSKIDLESRIARSRAALESAEQVMVFPDLHLHHIERLMDESSRTRLQLREALASHQSEKLRNDSLKQRLINQKSLERREQEGMALIELIDRRVAGR